MLRVGLLQCFRVKSFSVVRNEDLMAGVVFPRSDRHETVLPDPDAVADRVLHQRLDRQGRDRKVGIPDIIFDPDAREADLLDLGVDPGMLQFLPDRDQIRLVQRIEILGPPGIETGSWTACYTENAAGSASS